MVKKESYCYVDVTDYVVFIELDHEAKQIGKFSLIETTREFKECGKEPINKEDVVKETDTLISIYGILFISSYYEAIKELADKFYLRTDGFLEFHGQGIRGYLINVIKHSE